MPGFLKKSTASQSRALGPFVDDTDFKTLKTALTIANTDIKLVINGAASVNKNSGGGTHRVNGVYGVTFDATDTGTVGEMEVSVSVAGALVVFDKFFVVEAGIYDSLFAASAAGFDANQRVNVGTWLGVAVNALVTGDVPANTKQIAGAAVSTSTAQIGVNVVNFGGSAGTFAGGRPEVNVSHFGGSAGTFASGRPEVNLSHIAGSIVNTAVAQLGVNVVNAAGTAWGSGAITAASIAANAITAAKIATDAIGAAQLAADAVTEIQAGLSTLTQANIRTAVGLASANLDTQLAAIPTAIQNADALLDRDMATGTDNGTASGASGRTVRQALRVLRNKWAISGGTFTSYKENDSTISFTAAVTETAGNPVTTLDPA